jgi:DnaJ-class molecular chaperone
MNDPYETLGVNRSATDKEIKDAFKKLARKFHPDLHPDDKEAEGEPHRFFNRKDDNVHVEVPVTLKEAVLGARIEVPTIGGPVAVTVPKGSNTGTTLRLRDRGIRSRKSGQRGHQMINLKVILPAAEEPELVAFLEAWLPKTQQDPRKEMLP